MRRLVLGCLKYITVILAIFGLELKIKNPHVIAHSFGGRVAIYLASKYNELFNKIVLVDAAGVKPRKSLKKMLKIFMFKCGKKYLKIISSEDKYEERLKNYRKKFASSDYNEIKSDIMRQTFSKVVNLDLTKNLKQITRPVLLIWGKDDKDTPLYMAKIMKKNKN